MPPVYRSAPPSVAASTASLGNEKWWTVFRDPVLDNLIHTAIKQNFDVRIAAQRVLEAQAQVGIAKSSEYPTFRVGASILSTGSPQMTSALPAFSEHGGELDGSVLWDADFWGKFRRQTEAARDQLLATEWGKRAVISSVVSEVATAYFQLRALDLSLQIAQQTLASRKASLHLTQVLFDHGGTSMLDLRQQQELVASAAEAIPQFQREIGQQENLIRILLGENPGSVARGLKLTSEPLPAVVPPGLPAQLIERRPDIREAEASLMAANANIGVAKADFLPDFALTATGGTESYALNKFFTAPAAIWNAIGTATETIFAGGERHAAMRLAKSQKEEMVLAYEQAIKQALRQVSDSLIAYQKNREFTQQQALLTSAAKDSDRLSNVLYQHGGASFLQVLTSETNYFAAELNLVQAQLQERLALVQLYNALGGGWQQ